MGFQGADGLQQNGAGFGDGGLVAQLGGHDERHFAGVYRVIAAVQQGGFQANHGVPGQNAVLGCLTHALFHSGEEVLRHAAAEHVFGKLNVLTRNGLELDPHIAKLAVAAGLLLVAALGLAALADGFAVGYARNFQRDLNAKLVLQLGNGNFQVLGTQAADDLLLGFGVNGKGNGRIFFDQAGQRAGNLALIALFGNPDSHAVAGNGVAGGGQGDNTGRIA